MNELYKPPEKTNWNGRIDSSLPERYHQAVRFLNLNEKCPSGSGVALIGYRSDAGIVRNLGRKGASEGPLEFRKALANLAIPENIQFYDAGDIICLGDELEHAQAALTQAVSHITELGYFPLVIGGGHDLAYGTYLGLKNTPSIVNFDAHFDVRIPINGKGNSGTPFWQIAEYLKTKDLPFHYTCVGIQESVNPKHLFEIANELHVNWITVSDLRENPEGSLLDFKQEILQASSIFLNLDMDVFAEAFAPGVSAPQALGLLPSEIIPLLKVLKDSKKISSLAIAELSPPLDLDGKTVRLAAQMANMMIAILSRLQ